MIEPGSGRPAAILLTPVLPEPGGSGLGIRAWGWLVELAERFDVHVIVADARPAGATPPEGFPARSLRWTGEASRGAGRFWRLAGRLLPPLVLTSWRFMDDWAAPLDAALPDFGDVREIVVFRAYLHRIGEQLFARYRGARRVLDMDDLESATRASIGRALQASGQHDLASRTLAQAAQYRLVERRLLSAYVQAWLADPDDARRLGVGYRPNRIPNPGDWQPRPRQGPLSLLFVGSLRYPPNEQAARFVISELTPALRKALAEPFRIVIAGRQPTPELQTVAAGIPQVELVADAPSLDLLYEACDIVLVPLRSGGGTKLKTLEAMSRCRPVISTAEGVRGLSARPGEHYLAAETTHDFVAAITLLAQGGVDADALAEAGRRLCHEGFVID